MLRTGSYAKKSTTLHAPRSSFPAGRQQLAFTLAPAAAAMSKPHVSAAMRKLFAPPELDNRCATASGRPTTLPCAYGFKQGTHHVGLSAFLAETALSMLLHAPTVTATNPQLSGRGRTTGASRVLRLQIHDLGLLQWERQKTH